MAWDDDRNRRERYERERREHRRQNVRDRDRGPFDRAGDEMRSWFGDEEAERRRRMDERERGRRRREDPYDHYERGWDPGYRYGWAGSGRAADRNFGRYRSGYFPGDFYNRGYSGFGRGFGPDFTSDYDSDLHRVGEGLVLDDDVADYAGGPHAGRGPEGYQRSNERIVEDVSERLTRHGHVDATRIRVTAEDGEVTLEGTVDSRRAKRLAEDAAESVAGVRDVHNRLRIDRDRGPG
ncbi:MAG TPA: BON domain-containing protein [Trueperaceae bacterium]